MQLTIGKDNCFVFEYWLIEIAFYHYTCMRDELQYRDLFVSISPFLKKIKQSKKKLMEGMLCCS